MTRLGRIPFTTLLLAAVVFLVITAQEYSEISAEDWPFFLSSRVILSLSMIPFAFYLKKHPFSTWANASVCGLMLLYTLLGHYYRPLYNACFIQLLYIYAFLFFTTRREFLIISFSKTAIYIWFYLYTYETVKYAHGSETKADFIATVLVAQIVAIVIHSFFTAERGLREAAHERFGLVGRHASNIVHDIKSSINIPFLYLSEAKESLSKKDYAQTQNHLLQLEASLKQMEKTVFDLNQLSKLSDNQNQKFKISEVLADTMDLLKKRLLNVDVIITGDSEIEANRGLATSVFLNLFLNSLDSFRRRKVDNPKIEIQIIKLKCSKKIIFTDNGGGFSQDNLKALRQGKTLDKAESNSGIGLFLIQENMRALKSKVKFENCETGARVEINIG